MNACCLLHPHMHFKWSRLPQWRNCLSYNYATKNFYFKLLLQFLPVCSLRNRNYLVSSCLIIDQIDRIRSMQPHLNLMFIEANNFLHYFNWLIAKAHMCRSRFHKNWLSHFDLLTESHSFFLTMSPRNAQNQLLSRANLGLTAIKFLLTSSYLDSKIDFFT